MEKTYTITLKEEQMGKLLMLIEAGILHIDTHQITMSAVFRVNDNAEAHKKLMNELIEIRQEALKQISEESKKPKLTIIE